MKKVTNETIVKNENQMQYLNNAVLRFHKEKKASCNEI